MRNCDVSISTHVSYCSLVMPMSSASSRVTSTTVEPPSTVKDARTRTTTIPTPDSFRVVSRLYGTCRTQNWETAHLHLRRDMPADAIPAKWMAAWLDARHGFFGERVHAHSAVKHARRCSFKLSALCKQLAVRFVHLGLRGGRRLAARGQSGCGWTALGLASQFETIWVISW
jgi:hypothetical protein